jgi:hypothetical protein
MVVRPEHDEELPSPPNLQILCIASVTEMIFKFGEGKIRRSQAVSYLYGIP